MAYATQLTSAMLAVYQMRGFFFFGYFFFVVVFVVLGNFFGEFQELPMGELIALAPG